MGTLARLLDRRSSIESPTTLLNPATWLVNAFGGTPGAAGVSVTPENAMRSTAIYSAVRIITESIGGLPLPVYRRLPKDAKERAPEHPVYRLLHRQPHPQMTPIVWKETLTGHVLLWGNAYAHIQRDDGGRGRPIALTPLHPGRTKAEAQADGSVVYTWHPKQGGVQRFAPADVLHIPGLGFDGISGLSPIGLAREAIGLGIAIEKFGAGYFGKGSVPVGILSKPGKVSPTAKENIRQSWESVHAGERRVAVLEEDLKWTAVGIAPEESQFLQTRKFQIAEIARIFRIPLHMLAEMDRATFSNIEHQSLEFVIFTLMPWLIRWEQEINRKLFLEAEQDEYFAEHLVAALLRGDNATRMTSYATGIGNGIFSVNDIMRLENMNPIGPEGDRRFIPLNLVPLELAGEDFAPAGGDGARALDLLRLERRARREAAPGAPQQFDLAPAPPSPRNLRSVRYRRRLQKAHRGALRDAGARVIRREVKAIRRAADEMLGTRDAQQFERWLREFERDQQTFTADAFHAPLATFADAIWAAAADEVGSEAEPGPEFQRFVQQYANGIAARHAGASIGMVLARIEAAGAEAAREELDALLDQWETDRPDREAFRESIKGGSAFAKAAWVTAGILQLVWIAFSPCELCAGLDGKVVGIQENFVDAGDTAGGGDDSADLESRLDVGHPPLHGGCECMISAA
jgi:HK97 family phage portal protein